MKREDERYKLYVQVLKEELIPATGCTEPISIAYCAAKAREVLGVLPEKIKVEVSGNILKNVKSVVVPNTGNLKGVTAAVAAGVIAGKADQLLEVISSVSDIEKQQIGEYLRDHSIEVANLDSGLVFDIRVSLYAGESCVCVRISEYHTNIVQIEKDGITIYRKETGDTDQVVMTDRSFMNLKDIFNFAQSVEIADVEEVITRQIEYNSAISAEGLAGNYGANIGRVLMENYGDDIKVRAKAVAAAASDARMNGCVLPVVIVSGSGNQGIAASLPVIEYAKELNADKETTIRALVLSNLATIHQKNPYRSPFCLLWCC